MRGINLKALSLGLMVFVLLAAWSGGSAGVQEVILERLLICRGVSEREPVEPTAIFSLADGKAFAFAELMSTEPGSVTFVFSHEGKEKAAISLPYKAGRYRLWASKRFFGLRGAWRVELRDSEGEVLGAVSFRVE